MHSLVLCVALAIAPLAHAAAQQTDVPAANAPFDIATATPEQVKAWLKHDAQGNLLRSQIQRIVGYSASKQRLIALFGYPEEFPDSLMWTRRRDIPPVTVVEDRVAPDLKLGQVYYLLAEETRKGIYALGLSEPLFK